MREGSGCAKFLYHHLHESFGLTTGGAVTDGYGFDFIATDHRSKGIGGLSRLAHRGMRENGFVMEEIALSVQAYDLTARAEARINAHDALLTKGCSEEQLAQVLGEDADGFLVGALLAGRRKLILNGRTEQPLVTISNRFRYEARRASPLPLQFLYTLVVIHGDADAEDAFGLTTTHGEQAVRGAALEGFVPIKVVGELLSLISIGLGLDNFRRDVCCATESTTDGLTAALVLADHFCDDILCAMQSIFNGGNSVANKTLGSTLGIRLTT